MYRPDFCSTTHWNAGRAVARSLLVALVTAAGATDSAAAGAVLSELQCKWMPTRAACESPVRRATNPA